MRITAVHSYYSSTSTSGENIAVDLQSQALAEAGHQVDLFGRHTDQMSTSPAYTVRTAVQVASGRDLTRLPLPEAEGRDHLLVVHNLFPNFGNRWIASWPGPVVTMVHNFRYVCANGLLLRSGAVCTKCLEGSSLNAVRHRCYRGSALATLPLVVGQRSPSRRLPQLDRSAAVVLQTSRARDVFLRAGVPESRTRVVPGFTDIPVPVADPGDRVGWVFVGRISAEKGLRELLANWPDDRSLDVIGDGPDREMLRRSAPASVSFFGNLERSEVLERLPRYVGLVFPGVCWEGAHPMVVRESLAHGTPVVAARGSSAADAIEALGGGLVYELTSPQSLKVALAHVETNSPGMVLAARTAAESAFSRERWTSTMEQILQNALGDPRVQPSN